MKNKVEVTRRSNDIVLRVSLGGNKVIGYYCMYRGTRLEMIECLTAVLSVVAHMPEQPIEPEDA